MLRLALIALVIGLAAGTSLPSPPPPDPEVRCARNLRIIFEALQAYRRSNNGDFPKSLHDLHPRFVADARLLCCPKTTESRDYRFKIHGFRSSVAFDQLSSYQYELTDRRVPDSIYPSGVSSGGRTERDLKFAQRKTPIGDDVPIVRCTEHGNRPINLSFAGGTYRSPSFWEEAFIDRFPHPYLMPELVFANQLPIAKRIPLRPTSLSKSALDLTGHYNACLTDSWVLADGRPSPLASVHQTLINQQPRRERIEFDGRGIIQLEAVAGEDESGHNGFTAKSYPVTVVGIPVNQTARSVHFLHATILRQDSETVVARYVIKFAETLESVSLPVRYGTEIFSIRDGTRMKGADRFKVPRPNVGDEEIALTHWEWVNPYPDIEIESISLFSELTAAAPFVVAISLN